MINPIQQQTPSLAACRFASDPSKFSTSIVTTSAVECEAETGESSAEELWLMSDDLLLIRCFSQELSLLLIDSLSSSSVSTTIDAAVTSNKQ